MIENITDFIQYKILTPLKPNINCNFIKSFKEKHSFESRLTESTKVIIKYPDRVPIIVENDQNILHNEQFKNKYLVPRDMTITQFMYTLRRKITIGQEHGLYMFISGMIPSSNSLIGNLYEEYKDKDKYLYIILKMENTFGNI